MLRMKYVWTLTLVVMLAAMASSVALAGPWVALEYVPPVVVTSVPVANGDTVTRFTDVATDYWAWAEIEECGLTHSASSDFIVQGYGGGLYEPTWQVTRAQMAVFIARGAGLSADVTDDPFPDVGADYWAAAEIQACVDGGVVAGYDDGLYRPTTVVDRAQMAVFVQRAAGLTTAAYSDTFSDVDSDFWAATSIAACVDANIVQGYDDGTYKPDVAVTRSQMAVFVWRALVGDVVLGSGATDDAALDSGAGAGVAGLILPDAVTTTGAADADLAEGVFAYVVLDAHKVGTGDITFDVVDSADAVAATDTVAVAGPYDAEIDTALGVAYLVASFEIPAGLAADDYTVSVTLPNGGMVDLGGFTVP